MEKENIIKVIVDTNEKEFNQILPTIKSAHIGIIFKTILNVKEESSDTKIRNFYFYFINNLMVNKRKNVFLKAFLTNHQIIIQRINDIDSVIQILKIVPAGGGTWQENKKKKLLDLHQKHKSTIIKFISNNEFNKNEIIEISKRINGGVKDNVLLTEIYTTIEGLEIGKEISHGINKQDKQKI